MDVKSDYGSIAWRALARRIPMSEPMSNLYALANRGCSHPDLRDHRMIDDRGMTRSSAPPNGGADRLTDAIRRGLAAYGAGSPGKAADREMMEHLVFWFTDPAMGNRMFLTDLARDVAVLVVALEYNAEKQI